MFKDTGITPGLLAEFERHGIVIVHDLDEAKQAYQAGRIDEFCGGAAIRLEHIVHTWKGPGAPWSVLEGAQVLDLASGSVNYQLAGRTFSPDFARLCAVNGAHITAIDLKPQGNPDQQLFSWAAEDLVEAVMNESLASLPALQGKSFDLIHSSGFVGNNFSPDLTWQLSRYRIGLTDFEKLFVRQAGGLLAKKGIMRLGVADGVCREIYYTKWGKSIRHLTVYDPFSHLSPRARENLVDLIKQFRQDSDFMAVHGGLDANEVLRAITSSKT